VSNRKKPWKGRARGARPHRQSDLNEFEMALAGDRRESSKAFDPRADRKTQQLCRQVQRALMMALAGECGDDLLREILVDSIDPAGGAGHLLVRVIVPGGLPVIDVLARLNDRSGKLRAIVAASICRKRVPMLSFIAVPGMEGNHHD
jgi:ribosome-binding factor A